MSAEAIQPRVRRLPATVRRETILDAAITVFARSSYREAATAAIAGELGVSEPTIFRHFPTKRALYLAAIDRNAEITMAHWQEIAARSTSPLGGLLEMGQWYFAELQRDSRHLRLRFRSYSEATDPEIGPRVREHFRAAFDFIVQLYEKARDAGEIAPGVDVRAQAWLFMAIGALLDITQIVDLRSDLPLEAMPAIMMQTALVSAAHHRDPEEH